MQINLYDISLFAYITLGKCAFLDHVRFDLV